MNKYIETSNMPYRAHNFAQVNCTISLLLDPNATVRYTDSPRPRAISAMPTHPTKEIRYNPLATNELMRAYA